MERGNRRGDSEHNYHPRDTVTNNETKNKYKTIKKNQFHGKHEPPNQTKNESNILTLLQMFRFLAQMIHHNHYDEHEMIDQNVFFERYTGFLYYDGEVENSLMITKALKCIAQNNENRYKIRQNRIIGLNHLNINQHGRNSDEHQ